MNHMNNAIRVHGFLADSYVNYQFQNLRVNVKKDCLTISNLSMKRPHQITVILLTILGQEE